ncbi:MAG: hypothetical protein DI564_14845 [Rhodanobacter denitrificans]|uniref:Beta-lactamase-related domain-containing protein n=1 Tax=Rhodanobacter denitrificans TaxID=666685 RepID=A0A2W5K307_9GAMM|nr:MAG: hypothetical protein DI564_14845 [Rhodanobacter denitrificans]
MRGRDAGDGRRVLRRGRLCGPRGRRADHPRHAFPDRLGIQAVHGAGGPEAGRSGARRARRSGRTLAARSGRCPAGRATVRQLLNQTAGVRDHTSLMALAGIERMAAVAPDAVLAMMRGLDSNNFAPGSQARYSNGHYLMLAQLVERVSGRPLAAFAHEALFAPLDMRDTGFDASAPIAHGYRPLRSGGFRIADDQPSLPGSGGLVTTARDLVRFDTAFRSGEGVWSPAVKAMFLEPGRLSNGETAALPEFGTPYGAGVGLERRDGVLWLSHDGGSEGFRAQYLRRADAPVGAIVLCNRSDVNPDAIAERLSNRTAPEPQASAARPPREAPQPASSAAIAALVGHWRSPETRIDYAIRANNGGVQVTIRSPLAAEPVVEDWGGLEVAADGGLITGPLRLEATADTLMVSFGNRVRRLRFERVAD